MQWHKTVTCTSVRCLHPATMLKTSGYNPPSTSTLVPKSLTPHTFHPHHVTIYQSLYLRHCSFKSKPFLFYPSSPMLPPSPLPPPCIVSISPSLPTNTNSSFFAHIGTVFLWLYWPSFNAALQSGNAQSRAILNTYYSLTGSVMATFIWSMVVNKDHKLAMVGF